MTLVSSQRWSADDDYGPILPFPLPRRVTECVGFSSKPDAFTVTRSQKKMPHETYLIDSIYGISLHISATIVNYITTLLLFIFINNYMNVKMTIDSNIYFSTPFFSETHFL